MTEVGDTVRLRIGEVAEEAGVSTRTVRYYEQLGLLEGVTRTAGGTRCYTKHDVEVLLRIRELQSVMGFDLDQIGTILAVERRMDELRAQWFQGVPPRRQEEILREVTALNARLRGEVEAKRAQLDSFLGGLEAKAARYREVAAERGFTI
jgi:MerR family transcriptional regulator, repressor of the yfmOP operon